MPKIIHFSVFLYEILTTTKIKDKKGHMIMKKWLKYYNTILLYFNIINSQIYVHKTCTVNVGNWYSQLEWLWI